MLDLQCKLIRTCLTYDAPADPEGHSLPDTWRGTRFCSHWCKPHQTLALRGLYCGVRGRIRPQCSSSSCRTEIPHFPLTSPYTRRGNRAERALRQHRPTAPAVPPPVLSENDISRLEYKVTSGLLHLGGVLGGCFALFSGKLKNYLDLLSNTLPQDHKSY